MRKRSKLNKIICILLALVLTMELLATFTISLAKNTIGKRAFLEWELDKNNFYSNMRNEVEDIFKNYVYQSNLDDDVVKNIITSDKIEQDIKTALDTMYDDSKKEISTEELKKELTQRIRSKLNEQDKHIITSEEEKNIEILVDVIIKNYSDNMNTIKSFCKNLNPIVKTINSIEDFYLIISYIIIVVTIIVLSLVYIYGCKNNRVVVNKYQGIAFMTAGLFLIIINILCSIAIKENEILIFSKSVTSILISLIKDLKFNLLLFGTSFFLIGFLISLSKNIIVRKYIR